MKHEAVKAPDFSLGDWDSKPMTTDAAFKKGADLKEGVAGRVEIDTTYEQGEATCARPKLHY